MRPQALVLTGILLTLASGGSYSNPSSANAQALGMACSGCHDAKRQGPALVPRLIGMNPSRFIDAMHGFQSGIRPTVIMNRIAAALSEEEITALAAYFYNGAQQ